MKTKRLIRELIVVTLGLVVLNTIAFSEEHNHEMHEWELGVSLGYANLKTESEEGANLHLHLLKQLEGAGLAQYFSLGFGTEIIVTDEKHYGAMLTLAYHPVEDLTLSVSPGFEWAKHEGDSWEREYATHLEVSYSFDVSKNFHIGPVLGYSKTEDAEHYTVGIHVGIPLY